MENTLEKAVAALRSLPPERQEELAAAVVAAANAQVRPYTVAENAAIDEGLADADAGRFVTDDQLAATFARFKAV